MSIRVAIAGVGNCASSLVQGVEYYKDTKDEDKIPGLMHNNFGGYRVRDIEFVAAFDVDALKVGKDLSEAIEASQNNTIKFADVPNLGVEVLRGPTNDGLGEYYRQMIEESDAEPVDVAQVLRDKKVDVLVSYRAGRQGIRPGRHGRRMRVRELPAGVHRIRSGMGSEVP
jgi:myo-inositol-1-phosphate synthase